YCPDGDACEVGEWRVPPINFVDFADFSYMSWRIVRTTYHLSTVNANGTATFVQACPGTSRPTCGAANYLGNQPAIWAEEYQIYVILGGSSKGECVPVGVVQYYNGAPAPLQCS
ncbi:MAG: hypothetical protein ACRD2D_04365, partial [Terriglobales bacterium]